MSVVIPDEIVASSSFTEEELKLEIAIMLFEKNRLSMGQASALAGFHPFMFQKELAKRKISIHYTEESLKLDVKNLGLKK